MYRRRKSFALLTACAALSLLGAGHAAASTGAVHFMAQGQVREAPIGFLMFCETLPADCGPATGRRGAAATELDDQPIAPDPIAFDSGARNGRLSLVSLEEALRSEDGAEPPLHTATIDRDRSDPPALPDIVQWDGTAPSAAQPLVLDKAVGALLKAVNRRVNRDVRPKSDLELFGAAEQWSLPVERNGRLYGDCEDFALAKRHELIAAGLPVSALSLAVVRTRRGQPHAVLLVTTDRGEMVLDNLSVSVKPWTRVGYRWIMRQSAGDSMQWVSMETPQARG
jgi:predicted transglutaminase-like cysteine proteinase